MKGKVIGINSSKSACAQHKWLIKGHLFQSITRKNTANTKGRFSCLCDPCLTI